MHKKSINLGQELDISPVTLALLEILITWRNNSLHTLAENKLSSQCLTTLKENTEFIANNYRGLDPSSLPEKALSGGILTFKETASLINVAHNYVQEVDEAVISNLNKELFATQALKDEIKNNNNFSRKYSSLQSAKREKMIRVWLQNNLSYPDAEDSIIRACCKIKG